MPRLRSAPPAKAKKGFVLQKPNGLLTPRVQAVGPEHFGILAIDCAKARSRYFLADFYGRVLLEPTTLPHQRGDLRAAIDRIHQAMRQHDLNDLVVAIERTGQYHRPVQHAFRQAGFETRLVHPFTSKQYRQPADPGNKTDDTDLAGICRATTHGFGLLEPPWPDDYLTIQLLRRHRRDLVDKNATLQCQIREVLHAAMPGYAECFCHLWDDSPAPLVFARHTTSAQAVAARGGRSRQRPLAPARQPPPPRRADADRRQPGPLQSLLPRPRRAVDPRRQRPALGSRQGGQNLQPSGLRHGRRPTVVPASVLPTAPLRPRQSAVVP